MAEHAPLPPSGSEQWGHCSGSIPAQANLPDPESEQSREGTAAHWVMSETLLNHRDGRPGPLTCAGYLGAKAPNGVMIDDKMAEGAQVIVDDVLEVALRFDALQYLLIEHRVYMPQIHPENWGTLDVGLYLPHRNAVFLWDYKHGHREAKAVDSMQLADYLKGLCEKYNIDGLLDQQTWFVARIVQPYCYYATGPVREWTGKLSDLRGVWNQLATKAGEAFSNPLLTTGVWCRDCKAVGTCSAARRAGYNLIDLVNEPYEMDRMAGPDLAVERGILLDGVAVAKARLEAIEDELHHRIKDGQADSGFTLETSAGKVEWRVAPAQARALAAQFGVDASKDAVLTPTQTLAAAPAKIRPLLEQVMGKMTGRKAGKLKLVPAGESKTARAFKRKD